MGEERASLVGPLVLSGVGGLRPDSLHGESRLIQRAIRNRWNVPPEKMAELRDAQIAIALDEARSPKERSIAAKTVILMVGSDIKLDAHLADEQRQDSQDYLALLRAALADPATAEALARAGRAALSDESSQSSPE